MRTYTVHAGDTLSAIAKHFHTSLHTLEHDNPQIHDPNRIYVGEKVHVPGGTAKKAPAKHHSTARTYTVRHGDTMSGIAHHFGVSLHALEHANPRIKNPNRISVGEKIHIPGKAPAHHHPAHHPAHHPTHHQPTHHHHPAPNPHDGKHLIHGGDFSHYQSQGTFDSAIKNMQWAAVKATEGTGYTDPTFKHRWSEMGKRIASGKMKLRVAYCFLDEGNGAGQAKHFLNTLGIHGKLPKGTRLALDWEASALNSPSTLRDAANYIHKVTGTWPLVYCSASQVSRAKAAAPHAPIWDAKWGGSIPTGVPFVQYSDGPGYDHDVFEGTLKQLEQFAGD